MSTAQLFSGCGDRNFGSAEGRADHPFIRYQNGIVHGLGAGAPLSGAAVLASVSDSGENFVDFLPHAVPSGLFRPGSGRVPSGRRTSKTLAIPGRYGHMWPYRPGMFGLRLASSRRRRRRPTTPRAQPSATPWLAATSTGHALPPEADPHPEAFVCDSRWELLVRSVRRFSLAWRGKLPNRGRGLGGAVVSRSTRRMGISTYSGGSRSGSSSCRSSWRAAYAAWPGTGWATVVSPTTSASS
jgi:hypothetical protein